METKLIGDKAAVAIEFRDITCMGEATYGYCGLWLGGYQLHDADTPVCIDAVLASMQGVADAETSPCVAIDTLSSPEQMLRLMQERTEIQQHFFLTAEGFDDFLKLFSKDQENTYFLWALHPEVASLAIYDDYPRGVQQLVVGNLEMRRVVNQFAKTLEAAKG